MTGTATYVNPFQSTLSMRRATGNRRAGDWHDEISIHALHEESDLSPSALRARIKPISIHALHEESDCPAVDFIDPLTEISIHALHEESDVCVCLMLRKSVNFNPRSP